MKSYFNKAAMESSAIFGLTVNVCGGLGFFAMNLPVFIPMAISIPLIATFYLAYCQGVNDATNSKNIDSNNILKPKL